MYLLRRPDGVIVELDMESEKKYLLKKGFKEVGELDAEEYLAERKARFTEATIDVTEGEWLLDVYFQTADRRGDGFGMSAQHIERELREMGILLNRKYTRQKIALLYHRPHGVTKLQNDVRVIYSMFESDRLPAPLPTKDDPEPVSDWKPLCDLADKVLVPSDWCKEVFAKSGIEAEVVPLGYNSDKFYYLDRPIPEEEKKEFVFLHYDAFKLRKGFREVLEAFTQEFPTHDEKGRPLENIEPVKLIMRTTATTLPFPLPKAANPNIEVVMGDKSEDELRGILQRSNCFVFPSRGEGFGITPLEAMATGLPAIIPNAHGISHYFDPECMFEAPLSDEKCPGLYSSYKGLDTGNMVMCDIPELRKRMRYVYQHQKEAKAMGALASERVKKWSYKETAKKLAAILLELDRQPISKKRDSDILLVEPV